MYNQTLKKMAKIYGLFGSMNGKVADVVMAVRNGEQIVRKYQPTVANPSTPAQVQARAKLKLMSQLSTVMSSVIAMRRVGAVSSRNQFVKANYPAATYANNQADITLSMVKITNSVLSLPAISATRGEGNVSVQLTFPVSGLSRMVYTFFIKTSDNSLRYIGSEVVADAGASGFFTTTRTISAGAHVVYAYGVRDNTDAARAKFGNLSVPTAEAVAKLVVSNTLTEADVTLTETKFVAIEPQA